MPYLVSLTEWTVLDFIGFEDLLSGHKITLTIPSAKSFAWGRS